MSIASSAVKTFNVGTEALPVPADVAPLFQPIKVGRMELSNRIVYPPLTRCRALDNIPQAVSAEYYAQRAVPGSLLIAEATAVANTSFGYPCTPGVFSPEQVKAWKPITEAVHKKGAYIYCQIWHVGRASHPEYQPGNVDPVAPSAIAVGAGEYNKVYTSKGPVDYPTPRALAVEEIKGLVADFAQAAKNAIEAGFDGVEVHGANGYLIDQFFESATNKRTDAYGGSVENRARFGLEVVKAVVDAIGADRVGIRLSPFNNFLDCTDEKPYETFGYVIEKLNSFNLAYLHMVEPRLQGFIELEANQVKDSLQPFRKASKTVFIGAGGYARDNSAKAVANGDVDMVAIGRHFLSNPDLHKRFLLNAPLNRYDRNTFYTQGREGYVDYPFLSS
eukprot:CAMPEP_0175057938 /NCGR_PEP_ID=MMETSP0052_2-20121109/11549_1 /TAXON_ID=51329 ORGANISM="Polytomella parva, Strain SAG 63-3" /NCGR_SAMPLE_ID=MMETSP0052_2 /ASSEMBLY_ACC=CAM_ASM_000194 /LENGTH=389 /DNA_ID=CAMNT_0016323221 /DNA_START=97 /DNA_END=1266 /DNA_ORIENTATION=+